jgi:hypothetical protein
MDFVMEALIYWLRGRIAASRGARKLAYLKICLAFCAPGSLLFIPLAE